MQLRLRQRPMEADVLDRAPGQADKVAAPTESVDEAGWGWLPSGGCWAAGAICLPMSFAPTCHVKMSKTGRKERDSSWEIGPGKQTCLFVSRRPNSNPVRSRRWHFDLLICSHPRLCIQISPTPQAGTSHPRPSLLVSGSTNRRKIPIHCGFASPPLAELHLRGAARQQSCSPIPASLTVQHNTTTDCFGDSNF